MLYRPNYCSNCGEKIERVDWGFLTSRRFCDICETEFKGQDILFRAGVGVVLLFGVVGVGAYLRSGNPSEVVKQPSKLVERRARPESEPKPRATDQAMSSPTPELRAELPESVSKRTPLKLEIAEEQYFCGAETKKGTPCSRRVKGNTRCYQHIGMPVMASLERSKDKKGTLP
jgi:hypothetical protein